MSIGFIHNNFGNLGYPSGARPVDWEGWTGETYKSADGNNNYIFSNPIYGLRALLVVIYNKIASGKTDLESLLLSFRGYNWTNNPPSNEVLKQTNSDCDIIRTYFPNGESFQNEDSVLNLSNDVIEWTAKGIVQTEIPEYRQISQSYWDDAISYLNSGDIPQTETTGSNIKVFFFGLIILIGAGLFLTKNKK